MVDFVQRFKDLQNKQQSLKEELVRLTTKKEAAETRLSEIMASLLEQHSIGSKEELVRCIASLKETIQKEESVIDKKLTEFEGLCNENKSNPSGTVPIA